MCFLSPVRNLEHVDPQRSSDNWMPQMFLLTWTVLEPFGEDSSSLWFLSTCERCLIQQPWCHGLGLVSELVGGSTHRRPHVLSRALWLAWARSQARGWDATYDCDVHSRQNSLDWLEPLPALFQEGTYLPFGTKGCFSMSLRWSSDMWSFFFWFYVFK